MVHLGYFEEEMDAARAYDEAALHYYGPDAWTNFPVDPERLPTGYIQPKRVRSSRFKGVHYDKGSGRWRATLCVGGKRIHLGYFAEEGEAACVYERAVVEILERERMTLTSE
jgi:AP2-like factor (ANT lineage)